MTKRESTKYQYLKLIRENNQSDLDSRCAVPISQFMYHIKTNFINEYDPVCNIAICKLLYMYEYLPNNYVSGKSYLSVVQLDISI